MKLMLKGFFSILLLASAVAMDVRADNCSTGNGCGNTNSSCGTSTGNCNEPVCCDVTGDVVGTRTHFSLRPQYSNTARRMVATEDKIHRYGSECFNGEVDVALAYYQTFDACKLSRYFFGKNCLTYGNSATGAFDIYGANFGTTASGTICFCPKISNFVADVNLWLGWDEFVCGLWTRLDIPINLTRWELRAKDSSNPGSAVFPAGFVDPSTSGTQAVPFQTLRDAWVGDPGFGVVPPLKCGKICGKRKDTQVAGLTFDVGYDFYRCENGYVGAALHFVAPTGTRPSDEFLFNAVSGAQHMWEVGANLVAGYQMWSNCDGDQRLGIYFDATVSHLFKARQRRMFALKTPAGAPNPLSSYLVLKQFDSTGSTVIGLDRAANVLCCEAKIDAKVMADLALMVQYDCGCFSGGLGWNFWVRTAERFRGYCGGCTTPVVATTTTTPATTNGNCCLLATNKYGIKGNSSYASTTTYSNSTIGNQGTADATPVFLTLNNIDVCSVLHPKSFTNKVFGWFGYNWRDCEWQPFVAFEGEVEFPNDNKAANQWGVMFKAGVAF